MTKEIILPMNEITDSVEMLHEKPNKGMPIFTWILVLLLAAALTWCCIGEIDYFIKASSMRSFLPKCAEWIMHLDRLIFFMTSFVLLGKVYIYRWVNKTLSMQGRMHRECFSVSHNLLKINVAQ